VLALTYGFFVLAAGARSGVQIGTRFDRAPLAYSLSALASLVYTAGLIVFVLGEHRPGRWRWVAGLCLTELAGVLAIGAASDLAPSAFPDATVWSGFGQGYGYVPLALPVLGLWWALRTRSLSRGGAPARRATPAGRRTAAAGTAASAPTR
jgi:hypothetical protein